MWTPGSIVRVKKIEEVYSDKKIKNNKEHPYFKERIEFMEKYGGKLMKIESIELTQPSSNNGLKLKGIEKLWRPHFFDLVFDNAVCVKLSTVSSKYGMCKI
jgi:hypothetical protein